MKLKGWFGISQIQAGIAKSSLSWKATQRLVCNKKNLKKSLRACFCVALKNKTKKKQTEKAHCVRMREGSSGGARGA